MKHAQLILVGSVEMAGLAQSCIACQTKQQQNNKTKIQAQPGRCRWISSLDTSVSINQSEFLFSFPFLMRLLMSHALFLISRTRSSALVPSHLKMILWREGLFIYLFISQWSYFAYFYSDDVMDNDTKLMSWCLMSSDGSWHIRDKLWPMPKHGSINLYVHGNQKAR